MRGLFFVMKGRYAKNVAPAFVNKESNETQHIGGYDPYEPRTEEWYMVLDTRTFNCVACGSDFRKVVKGVYNTIIRHKGEAKDYFKHLSKVTSDDYYEVHYLGRKPLTREQRVKKAEGRCPRVSPIMRCLYERVYEEYGEFFSEEVEQMEDLAYKELENRTPSKKVKKLVSKNKLKGVTMSNTANEVKGEQVPKKIVPRRKVQVKML